MANYTYRDAIKTAYKYLHIDENKVTTIEGTNKRGIEYIFGNVPTVIFIYPISCKQDNKQNFFDTRDSGARERHIAWEYAQEKGLKYFCLGFNEEQDRYKDYVLSLESDENSISNISFRKSMTSNNTGTQVNIPNDFIPQSEFERIKTPKGFYISAIRKDYIQEYLKLFDNRPYMFGDNNDIESVGLKYKTGLASEFSRNRIVFGAPGTGKSYMVNEDRKNLLGEDNDLDYERVTFHPDYSYANFVGTYKPVMMSHSNTALSKDDEDVLLVLNDKTKSAQDKYDELYARLKDGELTRLPLLLGISNPTSDDRDKFTTLKKDGTPAVDSAPMRNHGVGIRKYVKLLSDEDNSKEISYEYVPGPFMRVYVEALRNAQTEHPKPYLLIIEEINRANVAAVFGDVFQLLDRGDDGVSEYPIQASEDIKKYLAKELGGEPENYAKIRIPDNMFIWATMNSADQGVFPMDTAFKRRWDFTYIGIDDNDDEIQGKYVDLGVWPDSVRVEWNDLRKAINEALAELRINEDKQLGPYFISKNIVVPADGSSQIESKEFIRVFKNKVLMYLYEDAAKQKHKDIFGNYPDPNHDKQYTRYSEICNAFDTRGISIFSERIVNKLKKSTTLPYKSDAESNAEMNSNTAE